MLGNTYGRMKNTPVAYISLGTVVTIITSFKAFFTTFFDEKLGICPIRRICSNLASTVVA